MSVVIFDRYESMAQEASRHARHREALRGRARDHASLPAEGVFLIPALTLEEAHDAALWEKWELEDLERREGPCWLWE